MHRGQGFDPPYGSGLGRKLAKFAAIPIALIEIGYSAVKLSIVVLTDGNRFRRLIRTDLDTVVVQIVCGVIITDFIPEAGVALPSV